MYVIYNKQLKRKMCDYRWIKYYMEAYRDMRVNFWCLFAVTCGITIMWTALYFLSN